MSYAAVLWRQLRFERRLFWRNPSAAFFNFLLPLLFLFLVASVYADDPELLDVLIPGIAGLAIVATTFSSLAFNITFLREQGILKRMRGTPMPTPLYLGGLLGSAVLNAVVQVILVVTIGNLVYGVSWPEDPLSLAVFTVAGVTAFAALGIALSQAIPNVDSAAAYVNVVFLPLIFISGVFYSAESLPPVLEGVADALPLKHVIDGLSGAIVTGAGVADNVAALAVVGAWAAVGILLAVRFFRWE
jgi:ABC-2 type transport system permease protein